MERVVSAKSNEISVHTATTKLSQIYRKVCEAF